MSDFNRLAHRVRVRIASQTDNEQFQGYDFTRLSAINTCPIWGIIRYGRGLVMSADGEPAQALNAGSAAHDFFAAVRLWQVGHRQNLPDHMECHGIRLFGKDRYDNAMMAAATDDSDETRGQRFALEILYSSGFEDSPYDRRRTMQNIEVGCLNYYARWDFRRPVWISDEDEPEAPIGVEIPFNIVVEPTDNMEQLNFLPPTFRLTGKIDGIHWHGDRLVVHENKTASRMDEAWRQSFMISHQPTGYMFAASALYNIPVDRAFLLGMQIPQPKSLIDGIYLDDLHRESFHFDAWLDWVYYTVGVEQKYRDNIGAAPKFTHSCNRYFRPCSLIPYCYSSPEEQQEMLTQMFYHPWSPLHEKTGD